MLDLAIRCAKIYDGSGAPGRTGSVGVRDGVIVELAEVVGPAVESVQADGLALMPGIIDAHTHYDAQVLWDSWCDPSPAHGVTTVVMGNCGFSVAPCRPEGRDTLMRHLCRVEGMSLDALEAGIEWDFETFPQYLEAVERRGVVPNVAAYIGHSALRAYVMGDDASRRAATDVEVSAMQRIVTEAMRAGAVGFSTSTHEQHVGDGGVPMPSRMADRHELSALTQAMAAASVGGMFMIVKGSGTSIPDLEEIAAACGRPVMISSMRHNPINPLKVFEELAQLREARERGRRLYGQCSCLPMEMDFTLENPYPFEAYDAWKPALAASRATERRAVFVDPGFRSAMKQAFLDSAGLRIFRGDWDKMMVAEVHTEGNHKFEGRSVGELARNAACHPFDFFLDLGLSEDMKTVFTTEFLNSDQEAVGRILSDPDAQISLGDGGAHLTFLCEAGFGLHLLGRWVRERGLLSWEEAVHRLTAQCANLFGFADRGNLKIGCAADMLLFDPDTVGVGRKERLYDLPRGATRLRTSPTGVHGVWVNGVRVVGKDGQAAPFSVSPGRVLRHFRG